MIEKIGNATIHSNFDNNKHGFFVGTFGANFEFKPGYYQNKQKMIFFFSFFLEELKELMSIV